MELPKVKSVTAVRKYLLHVVFMDNTKGDYDVSHLAGKGVFKSWDADDNFYKVFINAGSGTISWPGELDIDTINVYCAVNNIDVDSYLRQSYHAAY
ncbi:MAG: DUF2442 domain-containing protein [Ginsengibacter sp.]